MAALKRTALMEALLEQIEAEDSSDDVLAETVLQHPSPSAVSSGSHPPSPSSSANYDEMTEDEDDSEAYYSDDESFDKMEDSNEGSGSASNACEPNSPQTDAKLAAKEKLRSILQQKLDQVNAKRAEDGLPPIVVHPATALESGEAIPPAPYFRKRTYKRRGKVNPAGLTFADFRRDYAPEWVAAVVQNKGKGSDRDLVNRFITKYPEAEQWFNIHSIWAIRQGITFVNLSGVPPKPRPPPRPRKNPYKRLPNLTEAKYAEIQAYQALNPNANWSDVLSIFGVSKRQMSYMSAKLKRAASQSTEGPNEPTEVAQIVVE